MEQMRHEEELDNLFPLKACNSIYVIILRIKGNKCIN